MPQSVTISFSLRSFLFSSTTDEMRRPFAALGFTACIVLFILFFTARADVAFTLAITSVLCAVVLVIIRRHDFALPLIFITVALSCLLFLASDLQRGKAQSFVGDSASVEAVICEMPYKAEGRDRHYAVCRLETVNGERVKGKLRLSFSPGKDDINPDGLVTGNKLSFTGTLYLPGAGQKDIERYFRGENILLGAYGVRNLAVTEPSIRGVAYLFQSLRSFVSDRISEAFSDDVAGILIAVLTGYKDYISNETDEMLRRAGISHVMVVSGLHLSVWVFFIASLFPDGSRFSKVRYILLFAVTLFVMFLAGMSESVRRAGFMSLVHIVGCLLNRKSDSLNSIGFAVFVMLLFNPYCVLSLSFQLSVLSTLAIITLGKACTENTASFFGYEGYRKSVPIRLLRICFESFTISMSVLVFTMPVLIYEFGGISTVTALTNLLVSFVVTPILVLAGLYAVLSSVPFLAYPAARIANFLAEYVLAVARTLSRPEKAFLTLEWENAPQYALAFILIGLYFFMIFRKNLTVFLKRSFARRVYMCYNYLKYGSGGESNAGV